MQYIVLKEYVATKLRNKNVEKSRSIVIRSQPKYVYVICCIQHIYYSLVCVFQVI